MSINRGSMSSWVGIRRERTVSRACALRVRGSPCMIWTPVASFSASSLRRCCGKAAISVGCRAPLSTLCSCRRCPRTIAQTWEFRASLLCKGHFKKRWRGMRRQHQQQATINHQHRHHHNQQQHHQPYRKATFKPNLFQGSLIPA